MSSFDKYKDADKGIPIAVRAGLLYNQKLKEFKIDSKYREIHQGDKIKFAYVKQPNAFNSDVIGFLDSFPVEWRDVVRIDQDTMWEKAFEAPLEKVFEALQWDLTNKITSLESFFG